MVEPMDFHDIWSSPTPSGSGCDNCRGITYCLH